MLWLDEASDGNNPVLNKLLPFVLHSSYPVERHFGVSEADGIT